MSMYGTLHTVHIGYRNPSSGWVWCLGSSYGCHRPSGLILYSSLSLGLFGGSASGPVIIIIIIIIVIIVII